MSGRKSWFEEPSLSQVLLFVTVWLVGVIFSMMVMTNFFSETPFQQRHSVILILIVLNLVVVLRAIKNYVKK